MDVIDILVKQILTKAIVTDKKQIAQSAIQITLHSEQFDQASYTPGKFLRLFCGMDKNTGLKDKLRSYSVWNYDARERKVQLVICTHSNGPGSAWVNEVKVGREIYFKWHDSNLTIDNSADYYILAGDISSLGHLYELNRNLNQGKPRYSVIYANDQDEFFKDIDGQLPLNCYVSTGDPSSFIIEKLQPIIANQRGRGVAYIAGDSRVCIAMSAYLRKELKWPADQLKIKPFWNPDKKGLE